MRKLKLLILTLALFSSGIVSAAKLLEVRTMRPLKRIGTSQSIGGMPILAVNYGLKRKIYFKGSEAEAQEVMSALKNKEREQYSRTGEPASSVRRIPFRRGQWELSIRERNGADDLIALSKVATKLIEPVPSAPSQATTSLLEIKERPVILHVGYNTYGHSRSNVRRGYGPSIWDIQRGIERKIFFTGSEEAAAAITSALVRDEAEKPENWSRTRISSQRVPFQKGRWAITVKSNQFRADQLTALAKTLIGPSAP